MTMQQMPPRPPSRLSTYLSTPALGPPIRHVGIRFRLSPDDNEDNPLTVFYRLTFIETDGSERVLRDNIHPTTGELAYRSDDLPLSGPYRVYAFYNIEGTRYYSEPAVFPSPPESAPVLTLGMIGVQSASWNWTRPSEVSAVTGFDWEYRESVGGVTAASGSINLLTLSRTNIAADSTVQLRVRSVNAHGSGPWSDWVSAVIPAVPATPSGFGSTVSGSDGTWTWSASIGATSYRWEYRAGTSGEATDRGTTTSLSIQRTGLSIGRHQVRVRASNNGGDGPWTSWANADIPPGAVSNLRGSALGGIPDIGATGAWRWDRVTGATSYRWERRRGTSGGATSSGTVSIHIFTQNGLAVGTWQLRVRAVTDGINGPWSDWVSVVIPAAPQNISHTITGADTTWTWDAVPGAIRYEWTLDYGGRLFRQPNLGSGSTTSTTLTRQVRPGQQGVFIRLRAVNTSGPGVWVSHSVGDYAPGAIDSASITSSTLLFDATWEWDDVFGARSYDWEYSTSPTGPANAVGSVEDSEFTFTGAPGGATVYARFRAANNGGAGPWSGWIAATTSEDLAPAPDIYSLVVEVPVEPVPGEDIPEGPSYGLELFHDVVSEIRASVGASGLRRQSLGVSAGTLTFMLNNRGRKYTQAQLENRRIQLRKDGISIWGGKIDKVKLKPSRGDAEFYRVTALGPIASLGRSVRQDLTIVGNTNVANPIEQLVGSIGVNSITNEISDWNVVSGSSIPEELRKIQESGNCRIYEDLFGNINVSTLTVQGVLPIDIGDTGEGRVYPMNIITHETNPGSVINSLSIDGSPYTSGDSIDEYGEALHQGTFDFVPSGQEQATANAIFDLFDEPGETFRARFRLEHLAGRTIRSQKNIMQQLHYGNSRIMRLLNRGQHYTVEIMKVTHIIGRGLVHTVDLLMRKRDATNLKVELATNTGLRFGYYAQLPEKSADGVRDITGHILQYRIAGTTTWTDTVSTDGGPQAEGSFTVPSYDIIYEIRVVATSDTGNEQVSATITGEPIQADARYRHQFDYYNRRNPRFRTSELLIDNPRTVNYATRGNGIIGFDVEVRYDFDDDFTIPDDVINELGRFYGGLPEYLYRTRLQPADTYRIPQLGTLNDGYAQTYAQFAPRQGGGIARVYSHIAILVTMETVENPRYPLNPSFRTRPIFYQAGYNPTSLESWNNMPRGLWSEWQLYSDIPAP